VLHPICAQRLAHAALIATEHDVVVLSGWAPVAGARTEAALMAEAWAGRAGQLVIDPDAQSTVGNATNALDDVHRVGASHVVVVTSPWHAPRAAVIFRWCLRNTGATIVTAAAPGGGIREWLGELPRWIVLPLQLATNWPGPCRPPSNPP